MKSLFLLRIIFYGLLFGIPFGLLQGAGNGFMPGLFGAVFFGSLMGLAFAVLSSRREVFKSHPVEKITTQSNSEDSTTSFRLTLSAWRIVWFCLLPIFAILISKLIPEILIWSALILFSLSYAVLNHWRSKLTLSNEGLEYQTVTYQVSAKWSDLVGLERNGFGIYQLVFRDAETRADEFTLGILKIFENDNRIPLSKFSKNWQNDHLGELIHKHANF